MPAKYSELSLVHGSAEHVAKKKSSIHYTCTSKFPTLQGEDVNYKSEINFDKMTVLVTCTDKSLTKLSLKQIRIVVNRAIDAMCLRANKYTDVPYSSFEVKYQVKGLRSDGAPMGKEGEKQVKALSKAGKMGENKGRRDGKAVTPPRRIRGTQPIPELKKKKGKKVVAKKVVTKKANKKVVAKSKIRIEKKIVKKTIVAGIKSKPEMKSFVGKKIKLKLHR
jgi:hypothetical protein